MRDRTKLIELYEDYYGAKAEVGDSDMALLLKILEQLIEQAKEQDGHTHNIT